MQVIFNKAHLYLTGWAWLLYEINTFNYWPLLFKQGNEKIFSLLNWENVTVHIKYKFKIVYIKYLFHTKVECAVPVSI